MSIPKTAKDLYHRKFIPIDDERTFSIFDSLETKNNITRPFYILLVTQILENADGALSEAAGVRCRSFIENYPNYLLEFLFLNKKPIKIEFVNRWANQVSMEFSIDCENDCRNCASKSYERAKRNCNAKDLENLKYIYSIIKNNCP